VAVHSGFAKSCHSSICFGSLLLARQMTRSVIEWPTALDFVREGDIFTVTKLGRLARSVGDLLTIVATGRSMLAVIGAVGQAEREAMLKRVARGDREGQTGGRYKGRVPTVQRQTAEVARLKEAGVRPSEIASRLGIGRASVYRVLGASTGVRFAA
jgi:DNA invertase Pin-like site-specific DNA recombinase